MTSNPTQFPTSYPSRAENPYTPSSSTSSQADEDLLIVLIIIGGVVLFVLCFAVFAVAFLWKYMKTRSNRADEEKEGSIRERADAIDPRQMRENPAADALAQAAEDTRVRNLQAEAAFRTEELAAFRAQELDAEEQLAMQRSNHTGAYNFIGSPTVVTAVAEIQIAMIQLEAAFTRTKERDSDYVVGTLARIPQMESFTQWTDRLKRVIDRVKEELVTDRMKEDREWREAVRTSAHVIGAATLATAISNPCFTTANSVALATATATTVRTGVVYSADDGWASVAMATSGTGSVGGAARAASAPAPSAPPVPSQPHLVPTTPTSYSPITVSELRTQLLKLEEAIPNSKKVDEWTKHSGFLRGKWLSFVKTDDRDADEAYACAQLASSLLLLDKALATRRPVAKAKDLVWRDLLSNQGDVRLRLQLPLPLLLLLLLLVRTFTHSLFYMLCLRLFRLRTPFNSSSASGRRRVRGAIDSRASVATSRRSRGRKRPQRWKDFSGSSRHELKLLE